MCKTKRHHIQYMYDTSNEQLPNRRLNQVKRVKVWTFWKKLGVSLPHHLGVISKKPQLKFSENVAMGFQIHKSCLSSIMSVCVRQMCLCQIPQSHKLRKCLNV
jgi:hypothetical protein